MRIDSECENVPLQIPSSLSSDPKPIFVCVPADPCPADRPADYRVAIAVGIVLLILIIIVVVAYLLSRRKRSDGYQSL